MNPDTLRILTGTMLVAAIGFVVWAALKPLSPQERESQMRRRMRATEGDEMAEWANG